MTSHQATPTAGEMVGEALSLICFVAVAGPPVIFLAAPWLLLALLVSGPFALALTLVVALVAAAALVAGIGAIALLIARRLRTLRASLARPAAAHVSIELRQVAA